MITNERFNIYTCFVSCDCFDFTSEGLKVVNMNEPLYTLTIRAYKTDEVLLHAHGISLVCAYNLIKMYGLQKVVLMKEGEENGN